MGKQKKKLKFGFHYTWKEILPKSKILTVNAFDLDHAREKARQQAKKLTDLAKPTCHYITMPQDYDRIVTRARLEAKKRFWWKHLRIITIGTILLLVMFFLTSCSLRTCSTSLSRFNKKLTNWQNNRFGITTYYLQPMTESEFKNNSSSPTNNKLE